MGHTRETRIGPSMVCVFMTTWPLPWQFGQVTGLVPGLAPVPPQLGHFSSRTTFMSFVQPLAASSKESVRS